MFSNESIFIEIFQLPFDIFLCLLHYYIHIPIQTCKNTYAWRLKGTINACKCIFFIVGCNKQQSTVYLQRVSLKHSQHIFSISLSIIILVREILFHSSHWYTSDFVSYEWRFGNLGCHLKSNIIVDFLLVVWRWYIPMAEPEIYLWGVTHKFRQLIIFSVCIY